MHSVEDVHLLSFKVIMNKRPVIFVGVRGDFSLPVHITNQLGIKVLGILDKHYYGNTESVFDIPIIGNEEWLLDPNNKQAQQWREECDFFVTSFYYGSQHLNDTGLNNEDLRIQRIDLVDQANVNVINLIDPSTIFMPGRNIKIGRGVLIANFVGLSANITIGDYCIIDPFCSIMHDTTMGRNVLVGGRVTTSHCVLEDNVRLGVRSTVIGGISNKSPPLRIGCGSTVWTATSVMRDVPPDHIVVPPMPRVLPKQRLVENDDEI